MRRTPAVPTVTSAPAVVALVAAAAAVGLGLAAPAQAAPAPMVRLATAADSLSSYDDLGPLAASTPLQVAVTLTDTHVADEQALLAAQAKGAAGYTTPAAWDAAFAVPQATYAAARSFATADGLTVTSENGTHTYLLLSGTAAQVEKTFSVSLDRYTVPGLAKTYYATADEPLVPADAGIEGVLGLDDMRGAHLFPLTTKGAAAAPALDPGPTTPADDVCAPLPSPLDRSECSFFIDDFTTAYDLPAAYTGQGQKIGIFGEGDYTTVQADLRKFEAQFGRPQIPVRVVSVGDDGTSTDGTDEWDLDTQSSSGIARGAAELDLYFGEDLSDASINATYAKWVDDAAGPLQMNASFGECAPIAGGASTPLVPLPVVGGAAVGSQSVAAYTAQEDALRQARAEGRTLFASTGDQGGSCGIGIPNAFENNVVPELNVPAGSIDAVGVGGTDLETDGTTGARTTELGANAGGGGSSLGIHADTYQQGFTVDPTVSLEDGQTSGLAPCVVTAPGSTTPDTSGALCRSLPDVAALCGNLFIEGGYSGLNIYTGGMVQPVAGTSLASPLTMGMWARIQSADTNPAGYGFANLTIYRLGKAAEGAAGAPQAATAGSGAAVRPAAVTAAGATAAPFYDVTTQLAAVGIPTNGNTQHTTAPGYDQSTGWGVIDVGGFIAALSRTTTQVFSPVPPPATAASGSGSTAGGGGSGGGGSLAVTGLEAAVPVVALSLVGAGAAAAVLSRRRRLG